MLQDDYILRQIREMVRAVMKMLFQVSAVELTPDVIEDTDARQILTNLTDLADNGKIDEAENQLYEMTCDGDRQNLEIGLLFYYHLNGKDDEFQPRGDHDGNSGPCRALQFKWNRRSIPYRNSVNRSIT